MIQTVTEHDFVSAFLDWDTYKDCFSYEGLKSLFEYFENLIEETGKQIELDVVAISCEYEEFDDVDELERVWGRSLEKVQEVTTVIPVGNTGKIIVCCG